MFRDKEKWKTYLVLRHLVLMAFIFPVLWWLAAGPAIGFTNRWVCVSGLVYFFLVIGWALVGSRYIVYLALFGLGATSVSITSLFSAIKILNAKGGSYAVIAGGVYVVAILTISVIGVLNWRKGVPKGTLRLIDSQRGVYRLGAWLGFFRDLELGRAEDSEILNRKSRHQFRKCGWIAYTLLALTPIVGAFIITGGLKRLCKGANETLLPAALLYMLSFLFGLGAAAMWQRIYWFWKWEREKGKPLLIEEFAHRHHKGV